MEKQEQKQAKLLWHCSCKINIMYGWQYNQSFEKG